MSVKNAVRDASTTSATVFEIFRRCRKKSPTMGNDLKNISPISLRVPSNSLLWRKSAPKNRPRGWECNLVRVTACYRTY